MQAKSEFIAWHIVVNSYFANNKWSAKTTQANWLYSNVLEGVKALKPHAQCLFYISFLYYISGAIS